MPATAVKSPACSEGREPMGFLTDYEDSRIPFRGKKYRLDLAYDTVMSVQRMFQERRLGDADMLLEALKLFGIPEKDILNGNAKEASDLLQEIYDHRIRTRSRPSVGKQQVLMDFEDDGEYIYASFMQDYGINLIEQQGKLPWKQFIALFQGLSDDTKIKQVMRIRGMEIPAPTKHNRKEIQNLMELKTYYALGYREDNSRDGLERLFSSLEGMAQ